MDQITARSIITGFLGIAGVRKENGGVGRAKPAQHPLLVLLGRN
jgi:hypothetical protein